MADEASQPIEPAPIEPISTPVEVIPTAQTEVLPEDGTAQMGRNEPFTEPEPTKSEPLAESVPAQVSAEAKPAEQQTSQPPQQTEATPPSMSAPIVVQPPKNIVLDILSKARAFIKTKKRKKLEKIMLLFAKRTSITNDEVEKYLHCSDATATRYLSQLEKEGKIKQNGKTGREVYYIKI